MEIKWYEVSKPGVKGGPLIFLLLVIKIIIIIIKEKINQKTFGPIR